LSRKILVVTQFSFAIILIIATIYLYRQIDFLQHSDFGFEDEQIIFTNLKGEIPSRFNSVRQELLQHPYIESVTAAYHLPFANGYYTTVREAANPENSSHAVWDVVDDDYLHTLKMKLTQGRFFSREYPTDPDQAMVINESMVKALRFTDPIGQSVILQGKPYTIIGVIRDFHNRPLVYPIEPMVLTLGKTDYAILFARIDAPNANAESGTMNDIKAICQKFSPHYPLEFRYLAGFALEGTDDMQAAGRVLLIFTILGIGISCLGLYGLSLFLTEQRKKEVGIRKALGSSVLGIIRLFSKEYVLLLMPANAIAWPIAYFFVNLAIQSAYRVEFSFWIFIVTGVSVLLLALLTVGYRAFRTALANPVEALQYE
jgi:putative ABC transport system permease protein